MDLAELVRAYGPALRELHPLSLQQLRALRDIERCRTAALGGHVDKCSECGHTNKPSYNSCRNRHCPKCQALKQAKWVASRVARTLPTHHFHVVFTLPAELRPLASLHPTLLYDLLFTCASDTLLTLGRDPDRLNGQLGITAVLHTWTRNLMLHPHVHCIVTGGALSQDGLKWHSSSPDFLFHVNVIRELFRGKFLDGLLRAHAKGMLLRPDGTQWLEPNDLRRLLRKLRRMKWVVYCKRPFGGPKQVIRYLGQYTHRVAISNHRLVSFDDKKVTFRTRDGNTETLEPVEFLHRFVQHVLPPRFIKLRHYGLLAGGKAHLRRKLANDLLTASGASCAPNTETKTQKEHEPESQHTWQSLLLALTGIDPRRCPACGKLAMVRVPLTDSRAPPIREAA